MNMIKFTGREDRDYQAIVKYIRLRQENNERMRQTQIRESKERRSKTFIEAVILL